MNDRATIDLLNTHLNVLIGAIEKKDMVLAELEQENYNLARKMEDMKKQWKNESERNVQTELKLKEGETKRADLKHKCDAFFSQVEGLHLQLQQSEEDNSDLLTELRDRETRIQTVTDSVSIII